MLRPISSALSLKLSLKLFLSELKRSHKRSFNHPGLTKLSYALLFAGVLAIASAQAASNKLPTTGKPLPPILSLLLFEPKDDSVAPPLFKFQLPDSGLTVGGDYPSGINADCSGVVIGQQGCSNGFDVSSFDDSDGKAGFSYTKLDVNGNDLSASTTTWSCVRDNLTGFIWEIKTDDGGVRDKDNKYFWGGTSAEGRNNANAHGEYSDDWNPLVADANQQTLCGFSDWRVPNIKELATLIDRGVTTGPTIDTAYFPNTIEDNYWTSTPGHPDMGDEIGKARRVGFETAADRSWFRSGTFSHYHVRLIRTNDYQITE
jgi:hypothetical protein